MSEGSMYNNTKQGVWQRWFFTGIMYRKETYEKDVLQLGAQTWFMNGVKVTERNLAMY